MQGDIMAADMSEFMAEVMHGMQSAPLKEEFGKCVPVIHAGIAENFGGKHSPEGESWAPRKTPAPWPLEQKSGAMMAAATGTGSGSVVEIEPRTMAIGADSGEASTIPYTLRQQRGFHGTDSLGRQVDHPARPFVGASDVVLDKCQEIIADGAVKKIFGN